MTKATSMSSSHLLALALLVYAHDHGEIRAGQGATQADLLDNAAMAVGKIQPPNPDQLQRWLKTPQSEVRRRVLLTLLASESVDPAAAPHLTPFLKSRDDQHRERSALVLAKLGRQATSAAKDLLDLADRDEPHVRRAAIYALGRIDPPDAKAADLLQAILDEESHPVLRAEAADGLGRLSAVTKSHLDSLQRAAFEGDAKLRRSALRSLLAKGHRDEDRVVQLLNHDDHDIQWTTLDVFGQLPEPSERLLAELIRIYTHGDPVARRLSAEALARHGKSEKEAVAVLTKGLQDKDHVVQIASLRALMQLQNLSRVQARVLLSQLDERHPLLKSAYFFPENRHTDPDGGQSLDALTAKLRSADPQQRVRAGELLGERGSSDAILPLVQALADADRTVRLAVQRALASIKMDSLPGDAREELLKLIHHENPEVQRAALAAAMAWKVDMSDSIPTLIELLQSQSTLVRYSASKALSSQGSAAVRDLVALLDSPETPTPVKNLVALTLGDIGAEAKPALPSLQKLLAYDAP